MDCPLCNGTGYSPDGGQCHMCAGEGDITCDECGGTGIIEVSAED